MLRKISDIYKKLETQKRKRKLVLAYAHDPNALEAVVNANKLGYVEPILVGNTTIIEKIASESNFNLNNFEIIHQPDKLKAAETSVKLIRDKHADILMKGYIGTPDLLHAVLNKDWGLRKGELLSHFALFETENYHKVLALADVALNIDPDLKTKIAIINNSVTFLNQIGVKMPKVAILGAIEVVNENMRATLDAALISKMNQRGQITDCIIDGPLAFDNAISRESARHKGIKSEVAGDTDLLLMPNLETGNVLYKSLVFFAKAKLAGLILGAKAPIVLTSRSDSDESKLNSIVLAAIADID